MMKADKAEECFRSGFSCSQSVLSVYSEELGIDPELALQLSCGFGAGIGRTGNICGAVSGAVLVIGLKYGRVNPSDYPSRDKTYALVQQFISEFKVRHGSINCTELLGYTLSNPEDYEQARKENLFTTLCPALTRDSVEILERIL